ncbi:MAG: DUF126 domain-containing protein, partial [Pseudomonadota bacterium]
MTVRLEMEALLAASVPIEAPLLARPAALSFWGGLDVETGQIIDREHPAYGAVLSGRILCL